MQKKLRKEKVLLVNQVQVCVRVQKDAFYFKIILEVCIIIFK